MTAAAARKLQKEIDNVLKKVDDGIGEFAEYWEQATAAANNQQKEKLGEELKRSINKLQRLRAQIREWIGQSCVQSNSKDKLEDARKRIENDMQRFKDFERDLKTKAFSICALARADELELEEAEKMKYQDWLTQTIQSLNDQLDQFEADLELLNNKKHLGADDKSRLAQLKLLQERHRWHIKKLELVLRAVDNDAIDMSDLAVVRESIELYVDNHQDPDCYHDEGLYDCFDLVEFEDKAPKPRTPSEIPEDCGTPASSKEEPQRKTKEKEKRRKDDKKDKKKEDRDKKAAGTPNSVGEGGASGTTKANGGRSGDGKVATPASSDLLDIKSDLREKLDPDEVKVQEDQLLSEAEEFICKICQIHVVGCSPKLTSCSHLFCGDCIAQWFSQHPESQTWAQRARAAGPERVVPCPVCKQPLNEKRDLYPVCGVTSRSENLLLWRMLSSLKIMCANHPKVNPEGTCDWIGEYGSYQKHVWQCKNGTSQDSTTANHSEGPAQRALVDSESDAGSLPPSKDVSQKSTPAMTASPPSMRVAPSMLPSPAPTSPPAISNSFMEIAGKAPAASPVSPSSSVTSVVPAPAAAAPTSPAPGRTQGGKPTAAKPFAEQHTPKSAPPAVVPTTPAPPVAPVVAAAPASSPALAAQPAPAPPAAPAAPPTVVATAPQPRSVPAAPAAAAHTTVAPASPAPAHTQSNRTPNPHEAEPVAAPKTAAPAHAAVTGATTTREAAKAPADAAAQNQRRFLAPEPQESDAGFVAQAVSSFEPTGSNMVPVQAGDLIKVLEQHSSGWTYAKNMKLPASSNAGWVPSWIVQPVQGTVDATLASKPKVIEPQPATAKEPARSVAPAVRPVATAAAFAPVASVAAVATVAPAAVQPATPAVVQQVTPVVVPQPQTVAAVAAVVAPATPAPSTEARAVMRATAPFAATGSSQITLAPEDLVEIVERHTSGWTYGRKVVDAHQSDAGSNIEGWFPDWVVCPQK